MLRFSSPAKTRSAPSSAATKTVTLAGPDVDIH
jgi:hypothetical protein